MMLSAVETRPGYKELLRELIRSQIRHLVEQLSRTGEESFVVSAAGDDEVPHLIGSTKGLGYMKGFSGVQEGFLHYLHKNASTSESHQASKPAEKRQTLITHIDSNHASTVLTCVSEAAKSNPDVPSTSKPDNSVQIETLKDESLGVIKSRKQSEKSIQDVVQEHHEGNVATSKPVPVESLKKESDGVTSEPLRSNPDVTPTCKPDYSVQTETLKDESLWVIKSRKQSEKSIHNVVKEQPVVNEARPNTQTMPEESFMSEDKTFKSEKDAGSIITSTETNDETKTNKVFDASVMSAEVIDSDDEESDLDLDESDFDEMEEEEIFPQLINDFNQLKESLPEKMDISDENHADVNNVQSNANANAEHFKTNSPEGLKMESIEKTDAAKLTPKSRLEIPPISEDDRDEVKVVLCGESKMIQVYQFRNNLFSLRDTITAKDLHCTICKKDCRTVKELKEHEGSHTKMYCCYKCDKDLESHAKLRNHNSKCCEIPQFVKAYFRANPDCSPKKTWTASKKMKRNLTTGKQMKPVVKNNPPLNLGTSENGFQLFECEKCSKKFKFRISLKKHLCKALPKDKRSNLVESVDNETSVHLHKENLSISKVANSDSADKHKLDASYEAAELNGDKPGKEKLEKNKLSYKELLEWPILNQTCPFPNCGRKYHSDLQVKDHLVTHTTERPFKCMECKKKFKWKRDLTKHEKILHGHKHIRQRQISSKAIETASKIHAKWKPGSTAKGPSLNTLKTTTQQKTNGLKSNFKTPCKTVKQEMLNKYSDARIRKYKCPYCEKRYLTSSHLGDHVVKHTGVKNFKCSVCDETFLRRSQFRGHKKKCELQNPGRIRDIVRLNRKARPNDAQNKQILGLGQNIKSFIKRDTCSVKEVSKKTLRSMSEVDKVLATARECKVIENSSKVRCNVCGTELATMKSLRQHILAKHFIEKLYSCSCGERFHIAAHRRFHIKRMGCKFVKAVIEVSSGTSGANEEKSVSSEEGHKENSFNDSGTEPDSNTVHNTEPCRENVVDEAEQPGKEYLPELWPAQTSLPVPYICSICDARFSSAYDIVEHNIKEHDFIT